MGTDRAATEGCGVMATTAPTEKKPLEFDASPWTDREDLPMWFLCMERGNAAGLRYLLEQGVESAKSTRISTERWNRGLSILGRAALLRSETMVALVLEYGADPDQVCAQHAAHPFVSPANEFTPLSAAISVCSATVVRQLLAAGPIQVTAASMAAGRRSNLRSA